MIPVDILVATSADFARLRNGRPVASGMWEDVTAARATRQGALGMGTVRLVLLLHDGSEFIATDEAPGWDDLLDAAERALSNMMRVRDWWSTHDDIEGEVTVYRRTRENDAR